MLFCSSRIVASACLATAACCFVAPDGALARQARRASQAVVEEIAPVSREEARDIIFEMAPLQPVKKTAAAPTPQQSPAPAKLEPAQKPAVAKATKPVDVTPGSHQQQAEASTQEPHMALVPAKSAAAAPDAQTAASYSTVSPPADALTAPAAASPEQTAITPDAAPVAQQPLQAVAQPLEQAIPSQSVDNAPQSPAVETPPATPVAASDDPDAAAEHDDAPRGDAAPAPVELPPLDPAARIAALLAQGVKGPAEVRIADRATMWLPAGRIYLNEAPARALSEEAGLEWRPGRQGLVAPDNDSLRWIAAVDLLDDGYIKADPAALNAEKLLAAFNAALPEVNAQRARAGQPPATLAGWLSPPALDETNRLSACVSVASQTGGGAPDLFFNCEAWTLGRHGAVKVTLAEGGEQADRLKGEALALARAIVYDHRQAYQDADPASDKIARYTASDLLTSDVSTNGASSRSPAENVASLALLPKLWHALLIAAAIVAVAFAWTRRRGKPAVFVRATPRVADAASPKQTLVESEAETSLFARWAPSLSSKIARGGAKADEASRAASLSAREEPISALRKLALKMRGAAEDPAASVDVARAVRAKPRILPGAAPEGPHDPSAPIATAPEKAATAGAAQDKQPEPSYAGFGLIEPGDEAAASAAIHAREALRQASA